MQPVVAERPVTIPTSRIELVLKRPVAKRPKDAGMGKDVRAARQVQGQRVEPDAKARSGIALPDGNDAPQLDRPEVRQHAHRRASRQSTGDRTRRAGRAVSLPPLPVRGIAAPTVDDFETPGPNAGRRGSAGQSCRSAICRSERRTACPSSKSSFLPRTPNGLSDFRLARSTNAKLEYLILNQESIP
jgi:hypothetical protein